MIRSGFRVRPIEIVGPVMDHFTVKIISPVLDYCTMEIICPVLDHVTMEIAGQRLAGSMLDS